MEVGAQSRSDLKDIIKFNSLQLQIKHIKKDM